MHYHVDQGLQKNASFVYNNFLPQEIDAFINKMILRFIKDRFDRTDQMELGFEAVQKRLDDIRELIEPHQATFSGLTLGQNASAALPGDYLFYIAGEVNAGWDDCKLKADLSKDHTVPVLIAPQDQVRKMMIDPFRRTSERSALATITQRVLTVMGSKKFILKGVTFDYIRYPAKVDLSLNQSCDLADHTHDEIVDLTVQHILEVIASPRYQSNSAQANKTE